MRRFFIIGLLIAFGTGVVFVLMLKAVIPSDEQPTISPSLTEKPVFVQAAMMLPRQRNPRGTGLSFNLLPTNVPVVSEAPTTSNDIKVGVHFHPTWNTTEDDKRLGYITWFGGKVIRIGASWRLLEPEAGVWDNTWYLPALERIVDEAKARNIEVIMMLGEVPCWASTDPLKDCEALPYPNYDTWCPPHNSFDYANAFEVMATRFGDKILAWEVWNEPNVPTFWCNNPNPPAREYFSLLEASYSKLKGWNSDALVLGASLARADVGYLSDLYEAGAIGKFDGLAMHPYSGNRAPDDCRIPEWSFKCGVENIRSIMLENGDRSSVWFTEFGWGSDGEIGVGEEQQAQYLIQALDITANDWPFVETMIWYNLVDFSNESSPSSEGYFGLFNLAGTPKPAAYSLREWLLPYNIMLPLVMTFP